jgi:hypothetical protein
MSYPYPEQYPDPIFWDKRVLGNLKGVLEEWGVFAFEK